MTRTTNLAPTPAMKRRGCFLVATAMLLIFVVWFAFTFALVWLFQLSPALSAGMGVAVTAGAILLWFLGAAAHQRSKRGEILFDFGLTPDRRSHLIKAGWLLAAYAGAGIVSAWADNSFLAIAAPAYGIVQGGLNLLTATGRLQVLENGLWCYFWLLPWEKLHSYRWVNDSTLVVSMPANRLLAPRAEAEVPISIHSEHRGTLDALLAEKIAVPPDFPTLSPVDAP